ncbi:ubiquinol-cytochrome-c reductase complex assembly factor 1 isoform X4 [Trachemys scripta elegans]|uniref:ubiquinol-cytochrome-c reductase complex assembly factor 1 isoform X4 n=1 Tax=Trachemys scripta elegans TaxID=31138 RepID=UPI001552F59C|nr:ubiquinol-cytochrome-c reductase complex assembly factor 1 isoform X4 [Trachemys scripta elegans]
MFRKRLSVMAALVRAVKCQTGMPQWITVCSGLIQSTLPQAQWDRMLYGTLQQRHETGRPQLNKVCGGLIQTSGAITQQRRMLHSTNQFLAAKDSLQPSEEKVGAFTKIIEAMGFTGPLKYNKWKIKIAALRMYTCCVERTDYEEFFHRCHMPDTLNSWFLIAQLHVWMCLVRMKQEGRAGKYMCRYIVHSMWEDVEQRGKVMGGILSDDHVLAAALWRNLFNKHCEDPRQLELLVEYVRKQMQYLDAINGEDLLLTGEVNWRPLVESNAQSILKPTSPAYNDEGL